MVLNPPHSRRAGYSCVAGSESLCSKSRPGRRGNESGGEFRRVIEVLGKITNKGDRPVKEVALTCIFSDLAGQHVHREKSAVVRVKDGALKPGETRNFRLPFDTVPSTWNQALPQMVIAQIVFDQ